jgi:hypothetical protein
MRIEDQRGGNGSVPGTRRKAVPIAMATDLPNTPPGNKSYR